MNDNEDQPKHAAFGRCDKHNAVLVTRYDESNNSHAVSCPLCEVEELDSKIIKWAILGGEDE